MRHSKGYRNRSRHILSRDNVRKGLSMYLIRYNIGDRVHIKINPIAIRTAPHRRYHGKTGVIIGKRGRAYIIEVRVGNDKRTIITTPEHLLPYEPA